MARVKLNDRFEFPLEIEMGMYLENPQDNLVYELQGIIIHRGNAHGGHYHAYFRDLLDEADWNGHIAEYWNEKTQ
jgi:ubiquitin carboxyl-terminal hydrolase 40